MKESMCSLDKTSYWRK